MPVSSSVVPWTLTMPLGSLQQWAFTFTQLSASGFIIPYPISGATWEYVARTSATDLGPPVIDITTSSTAEGQIAVTATASLSQIILTMFPAATLSLAPQVYYHTLWMQPTTSGQFTWLTGQLVIEANPQP